MDKLIKSSKSVPEDGDDRKAAESVRREVVVEITGHDAVGETELTSHSPSPEKPQTQRNEVRRDTSCDFSGDPMKAAKGLHFGADSPPINLPKIDESPIYGQLTPREVRVSFNEALFETAIKRRRFNHAAAEGDEEVVVCSANSSVRRKSNVLMTRMKSRLMDPPPEAADQRCQTPKTERSGMFGKAGEIDEDDPFLEDDLPEEYKKVKLSKLSLLQLLSLILFIAALSCTLSIAKFRRKSIFELKIWKWEVMVLVLISGRLVSGWFIRLVVFFIERNFLLRKRVLYFVYGVKNAVQSCIWLALVLISWHWIFDKKVKRLTNGAVLHTVTRIWIALLVTTIIWLLKTLLVNVLSSSFHVKTYFDRIQESLFDQYVIETLSGPPLVENRLEQEEEERTMAELQKFENAGVTVPPDLRANVVFKKERVIIGSRRMGGRSPRSSASTPKGVDEEGISIDHLHRLNQKNVSAWNMKKLMNIVRNGMLSTMDEQIHDLSGDDEAAVEVTSEGLAKAAAKKIFYNVAKPGSKCIYLENLMRFLREDEACKAISLIEGTSDRKGISKGALKTWVVNVFRERRALALSLIDTTTAVNKLHQMLNVAVAIVTLVISLLILKITSSNFFIVLGSQLLLVGFMFGNTCKTTFESIIFLFVMHPYDVGDRCEIDGVQMVVEEMNILTTVFLRFDKQKIIYPNSVLATKPISNYYRSPDMTDAIDFSIHVSTPMEKFKLMKERITSYVDNKSDHWYPEPKIVLRDVEDMNRLKVSLWFTHRMNHQNMSKRWVRRSRLVEEMINILRDLHIEYRTLPMDVNVRNMPAIASTRLPSNWNTTAN